MAFVLNENLRHRAVSQNDCKEYQKKPLTTVKSLSGELKCLLGSSATPSRRQNRCEVQSETGFHSCRGQTKRHSTLKRQVWQMQLHWCILSMKRKLISWQRWEVFLCNYQLRFPFQFKVISMCPTVSGKFPPLPLKEFQCLIEWLSLILSRKIV